MSRVHSIFCQCSLKRLFVAAASTLLLSFPLFSQQDSTAQRATRITLADGSELIGTVVGQDSATVHFRTLSNINIAIPKTEIRQTELLPGIIQGNRYISHDPNLTRLFIAPTARSLQAGQGYFSIYEIFFPLLAIGIADFVTLGSGLSLFPGAERQLIYFTPKITPLQWERFSVAVGTIYITSTSAADGGLGVLYALSTFGTASSSVTAGLGWDYSGNDIANLPVLLLGGELRVSKSLKWITENWIFPRGDAHLLSFGIRIFGERLAADLGFFYVTSSRIEGFPFIPWIGFAYNFGSK